MANAAEDVFRMVPQMKDSAAGTRFQNVFYARLEVAADPQDATIAADAIEIFDAMYGYIEGQISTDVVGEHISITNVTKRERVAKPAWTWAGTNAASESLPPQVSPLTLWPLKAVGRTGRTYWPPFVESAQSMGIWQAAALTALDNVAQAVAFLWNALTSTNEYSFGIARFNGTVLQDFTEFRDGVWTVVKSARTQRRRTSGFGLS